MSIKMMKYDPLRFWMDLGKVHRIAKDKNDEPDAPSKMVRFYFNDTEKFVDVMSMSGGWIEPQMFSEYEGYKTVEELYDAIRESYRDTMIHMARIIYLSDFRY